MKDPNKVYESYYKVYESYYWFQFFIAAVGWCPANDCANALPTHAPGSGHGRHQPGYALPTHAPGAGHGRHQPGYALPTHAPGPGHGRHQPAAPGGARPSPRDGRCASRRDKQGLHLQQQPTSPSARWRLPAHRRQPPAAGNGRRGAACEGVRAVVSLCSWEQARTLCGHAYLQARC